MRQGLMFAMVVAAALAAAAPAVQAAADEGGVALTLEEALQIARKNNRSLAIDRAKIAQAEAQLEQGWSALFPVVAAQGKFTHNNWEFKFPRVDAMGMASTLTIQPYNQLDGVIGATMPLVAPAAYPALESLKAAEKAAEANYSVSEATVLLRTAELFYAASISEEVLAARHSNVEVSELTLKNAQIRLKAGTTTKVDVDRAELALVKAQQQEREAISGNAHTYLALSTLIQKPLPFKALTPHMAPERHDERELDRALSLRAEFRSFELITKSYDLAESAHAWRWAPTLSGFGNARIFNYDNFAARSYAWAVGAQLDWALYDGGVRDTQRKMVKAQKDEFQARVDVLRDQIRDSLADGNRNLQTKLDGLGVAERSVELAKETLDLVRTQYEAGTVTQVDLLQAQDALVASQVAVAQAHFDVATADLTLRYAAGTFPGK